jgi:hypothetical protein
MVGLADISHRLPHAGQAKVGGLLYGSTVVFLKAQSNNKTRRSLSLRTMPRSRLRDYAQHFLPPFPFLEAWVLRTVGLAASALPFLIALAM